MPEAPYPRPVLHLPYEAGPFRMVLGITAIPERDWI